MCIKRILALAKDFIKEKIAYAREPKEIDIFSLAFSTLDPCGPLTDEEAADLIAYVDSFYADKEEQ